MQNFTVKIIPETLYRKNLNNFSKNTGRISYWSPIVSNSKQNIRLSYQSLQTTSSRKKSYRKK